MSVRVVQYPKGGWNVDIRLRLPDGKRLRDRHVVSHKSKSAAKRWGEDRERHLLQHGPGQPRKGVPTIEQFRDKFLEHCRANRQKPSTVHAKASHLDQHLIPMFRSRPLDQFSAKDVEAIKELLKERSPKTVNNVFSTWRAVLKAAVALELIEQVPIVFRDLKALKRPMTFYDFDEYERYVDAATKIDSTSSVIALLGGRAGLRAGEMLALEWTDIDFTARQIKIDKSCWGGTMTAPKSGKARFVPLTPRLATALRAHRHLRSSRVLCSQDGKSLTWRMLFGAADRISRRAGLNKHGVHILRHTFGSHAAMRSVPARVIQDWMGHADLQTTLGYMHLSPVSVNSAAGLLEPSMGQNQDNGTSEKAEVVGLQ